MVRVLGREIRQRDAADFDVVFGRHGDFRVRVDVFVAAAIFGAALHEDRLVVLRRPPRRLIGRRPERARGGVAQIAERAPPVARRVLAPAGDRQVFPPAVPAARVGGHDVIAAVGQQVHLGNRRVRRREHAHGGGGDRRRPARGADFRRVRLQRGSDLGNALVQQQLRRLEGRVGQEPALHGPVQQQVRERQEAHPLVMRHETAERNAGLAARHARGREIDRFIKPVRAAVAGCRQRLQILACLPGRDHQRQHRRVRRDDQIVGETALEPQPRHAERAILIDAVGVGGVVARLGNAPRHAALAAVFDLAGHDRPVGLDRAACARRSASPAAASGTRTSSRSTTTTPSRRRGWSTAGPGQTNGPAATGPGR